MWICSNCRRGTSLLGSVPSWTCCVRVFCGETLCELVVLEQSHGPDFPDVCNTSFKILTFTPEANLLSGENRTLIRGSTVKLKINERKHNNKEDLYRQTQMLSLSCYKYINCSMLKVHINLYSPSICFYFSLSCPSISTQVFQYLHSYLIIYSWDITESEHGIQLNGQFIQYSVRPGVINENYHSNWWMAIFL